MKVYPIYIKPKYFPNQFWNDEWIEEKNKKAEQERQHLSEFCEQKLGVSKYGEFVYFEYSGSLDDFAAKYGGSFVLRQNHGENYIQLKIYEESIHDAR